jgi:homoserine O-succinyltransferase/O-acetyltransferase
MPLVAHTDLPAYRRLAAAGEDVLSRARAEHQDVRELHIGLLNMMPDAALEATERQFLRLIGACNRIVQFYVHPFTIEGVDRAGEAREHVERYYDHFTDLQRDGLDALIITGANVTEADITTERFWGPMVEVMDWARDNVCSTYCSCLSSHGAFKHFYGIDRTHLDAKQWGVYSHRVIDFQHPLFNGTNTRFDVPHSRFNDVPGVQMEAVGLRVLATSDEAGVLCATSPDGFRYVYFQGHPEYDAFSLLKEYKREVYRYVGGERPDYPPFPEHYFVDAAARTLNRFRSSLEEALAAGCPLPEFPEDEVSPLIDNTWADTAKAIFNNWLGLVYQLTDWDRKRPFMPEVNPSDPLGLLRAAGD